MRVIKLNFMLHCQFKEPSNYFNFYLAIVLLRRNPFLFLRVIRLLQGLIRSLIFFAPPAFVVQFLSLFYSQMPLLLGLLNYFYRFYPYIIRSFDFFFILLSSFLCSFYYITFNIYLYGISTNNFSIVEIIYFY